MKVKENELKLLKQQNEILRQELENNKIKLNNNNIIIVSIVIIIGIVFAGITIYFLIESSRPNESIIKQENNIRSERVCKKWKNTYNFDWCEYHFTNGCSVTGQECSEYGE